MPNTEVKLTNAESTWLEAAREDRKLLVKEKRIHMRESFFLYLFTGRVKSSGPPERDAGQDGGCGAR